MNELGCQKSAVLELRGMIVAVEQACKGFQTLPKGLAGGGDGDFSCGVLLPYREYSRPVISAPSAPLYTIFNSHIFTKHYLQVLQAFGILSNLTTQSSLDDSTLPLLNL